MEIYLKMRTKLASLSKTKAITPTHLWREPFTTQVPWQMLSKMPWTQKRVKTQTVIVALIPTPADLVLIVSMALAVPNGVGVVGQLHTAANVANQIVGPRSRLHMLSLNVYVM